MANDNIFTELTTLLATTLNLDCPILSGNMSHNIQIDSIAEKEGIISVSGPSYDMTEWRKTGVIRHNDKYDYAVSVNNVGAFGGRSTKSKHWVNKTCEKVCQIIAKQYDAEVIVNVEL